jgi:polar amino acid transport system permease protein
VVRTLGQLFDPGLFWEYRTILLAGVGVTLQVFAMAAVVAVVLGLLACLLRLSGWRPLRWMGTFYAELCRDTPEYVLLIWVHYVPPLVLTWLTGVRVNFAPAVSAVIALGLASSGYFTETFRAGILAVPRGHVEAARSLSMSSAVTLRRIVLPQAVRRMLPEAMNQFISLFKATTLVSLISVADLMYQVSIITQEQMRPLPLYSGTAFIYFLVILAMSTSVRRFTERWRRRGWA